MAFKKIIEYVKKGVYFVTNLWYNYIYDPSNTVLQDYNRGKRLNKYKCLNCGKSNAIDSPICTCNVCGQVTIFEDKLMEHVNYQIPAVCLDGVTAQLDTWQLFNEIQDMDDSDLYDEVVELTLQTRFPAILYKYMRNFKETGVFLEEERKAMEGAYLLFHSNFVFGEVQ